MNDQDASKRDSPRSHKRSAGMGRRNVTLLAMTLVVFSLPTGTHGAERTIAPDIRVGGHANDNARLSENDDNQIEIAGAFVELGLLARWRTPSSDIQLRPRFLSSRYPGDEDEESDDTYVDFSARNLGMKTEWVLRGNYAREEIIRGGNTRLDFADPELDIPEEVDTGRIDARRRLTLWRLAPSFSYELSERSDAGLGLSYLDASYSPQQPGEALDYTDVRLETFFEYGLSPTSRFRTTGFISSFDVDANNNDTTSYGLRLRYERDISEVYDIYADLGVQENDVEASESGQVDDSSTGFLLDIGLRRIWDRTEFRIAGGRSSQPSGTGALREVDQVRLNLRHQFQPRWFGELAGVFQDTTNALDDAVDSEDREYYQLRARLGYQLNRNWNIEGSYSFTWQDYQNTLGEAEANEVFISVNYQPRARVW